MMDRRQFLRGALAAGVVAVGVSAAGSATASAAPAGKTLGSAESFLLGTARRAIG